MLQAGRSIIHAMGIAPATGCSIFPVIRLIGKGSREKVHLQLAATTAGFGVAFPGGFLKCLGI
jgi:hypothetical protein